MDAKPHFRMGLRDAVAALRGGRLRSEDLTRALLERIAAHEGRVQAFQWIDAPRAMALARAADERLRQGQPPGVLHGIPVGIKDIIATQGIPTTMGSPIFENHLPSASAAVVERLERAGAFVMGKTVTTEFAYYTPRQDAQSEPTLANSATSSCAPCCSAACLRSGSICSSPSTSSHPIRSPTTLEPSA